MKKLKYSGSIPTLLSGLLLACVASAAELPPPASAHPPAGLIQPLWQVREIRNDSRTQTITYWKAERVFETQQALLTRSQFAGASDEPPTSAATPLTRAITSEEERHLRDLLQALILQVPPRDENSELLSECPHSIELSSASAARILCDRSVPSFAPSLPASPPSYFGSHSGSPTSDLQVALDLIRQLESLTN